MRFRTGIFLLSLLSILFELLLIYSTIIPLSTLTISPPAGHTRLHHLVKLLSQAIATHNKLPFVLLVPVIPTDCHMTDSDSFEGEFESAGCLEVDSLFRFW
jgi:hypothetical protein